MEILILDNDMALLRSLEIVLGRQERRITALPDPERACAHVEANGGPDVLILDFMMPGMTGADVLQRLRAHLAGKSRVMLISGHREIVEPLDLAALGVDEFLAKPLDLQRLDDWIAGAA